MPYYLTSVAELPYPHAMGVSEPGSNCPLALATVIATFGQHPGRDGYRQLFTDAAIAERRRSCDVHAGDWAVVLPLVTAFLEPFPARAKDEIYQASIDDPRIIGLPTAERLLAKALLNTHDPVKYFVNAHGRLESNGQHRICWARTAGVAALPVWFDTATAPPPPNAKLLQRG